MTTKTQIIRDVATETDVSNATTSLIIETLLRRIASTLAAGDDVQFMDFGSFRLKHRAERTGRNPATGEQLKIAAYNAVTFLPAEKLKQKVRIGDRGRGVAW